MIHVVLMGNVLNGFTAIGPFRSFEEARKRVQVEHTGLERSDAAVSAQVREIPETDVREPWLIAEGSVSGGFRFQGPVSQETGQRLIARDERTLIRMETPE